MSKKIKILYTIPNFDTAGSGKSVYDLVKGIDRAIFDPEICCFHNRGNFFKEVEKLDVKIHIFPFTTTYNPKISFLSRVLKIRNFFKSNKFDIIHSWHWSSDISEPLAAKLAGIPYVYTKKAMGWNKFWTWRSKLSSKVVVVNEDMVTLYFSKMLEKIDKFPLAIDTNYYKPYLAENKLKDEIGIQKTDFIIVSIANLVPVKGIETLFKAVLKLKNTNIKTLVIGNDNNEYGVKLINDFKQYENILFLGKKLDIRPYLALADLFIIPTNDEGRREGIPNAPLEAMAMEIPVLGSNISGIKDILKEFPDCLFQASNEDELSYKINTMMRLSEKDRKILSSKMRDKVIDEFSIVEFLKNHENLYLRLVK
ncbi:MAG: glycosyltransferase family 1 protein [Bacteroidetes bacterium]|nr:MAG: glycosyltransferase family 1 protein [Bacteroidota bacterium]